jgi:hypothetical protein
MAMVKCGETGDRVIRKVLGWVDARDGQRATRPVKGDLITL